MTALPAKNEVAPDAQGTQAKGCFHCGEPLPQQAAYPVVIDGREQLMCCPGCQAVAAAIVDGGLARFYEYRTGDSQRPDSAATAARWQAYDLPEVQQTFVSHLAPGKAQAHLLLEGISCAACSWLIETHLRGCDAVSEVRVNVTSHRCQIVFDPDAINISALFAELESIGYRPRPATDDEQQKKWQRENRLALARLGVAGFGMMQAGMVAVGLYTGAADEWQSLLRWLSLLLTTPVVLFSAWPFFRAAFFALKRGYLIMDVPVALAVGLGFGASCWATLTDTGDVYFESIAMFVFFLLVGRYLELRARAKSRTGTANLAQLMPPAASRWQDGQWQQVPLAVLAVGDRLRVNAGESFPADGIIFEGATYANEALLTGESVPVAKASGASVIAGSENIDSPVEITVTATGAATRISAIERLIARGEAEKPKRVALADRVARYFVAAVLVVCALVYLAWHWTAPERALWVALSVLVVTCPCALALAVPAAMTAVNEYLRRFGVLVARGHVIETLPTINRVIFDKTGTLTEGRLRVAEVVLLEARDRDSLLSVAAALEQGTSHPIARAFNPWSGHCQAHTVQQIPGQGVSGVVQGISYRLGSPGFVTEACDSVYKKAGTLPDSQHIWLLLADNESALAWIGLADSVRPEARQVIDQLRASGLAVELLSGDSSGAVTEVARELGFDMYRGGATPADKLSHLLERQSQGDKILVVGDGINDVPLLSAADISVAMASASDLARVHADCLLLKDDLRPLTEAFYAASRARRVVRQNLGFSLGYNLLALPLAALGLVPPWAAAIGMTSSSLVVVFNALRLGRRD